MKPIEVKYRTLGISVLPTLACLLFSVIYFETLTLQVFTRKLGLPLLRLLLLILIGLFAGRLIENLGWTKQVAILARPFFRFLNLGNRSSAAFTTAFISGAAANAMLLDFYKENKISKTQLFLSNYINQFPAFFLRLPTTVKIFCSRETQTVPRETLILRPALLSVSIECNRITDGHAIKHFLYSVLEEQGLSSNASRRFATTTIKSDEPGLLELSEEINTPIDVCYKEALNSVKTIKPPSKRVEKHLGVKSVCEAAAILSAGNGNLLVVKKKNKDVTIAVAIRK